MSPEPVAAELVEVNERPPRDNLVRAQFPPVGLRGAEDGSPSDGRLGTIFGRMANYNTWGEVNSITEGHFMELVYPGAFSKTFAENRSRMQIIYDHGHDRSIGRKPLGPLETIDDDDTGLDYTGALINTSYNHDLAPGLRANLYGSSYRFNVVKEDVERHPRKSEYNPLGLPERSIREAKVVELGPTPFPIHVGTFAGMRSVTDLVLLEQFANNPDRLRELMEAISNRSTALPVDGAEAEPHSDEGSRDEPSTPVVEPVIPSVVTAPRRFRSDSDWAAYLQEFNR